MQGNDFPGSILLSGVKQGCPLSPLLFAVCVDILLRRLTNELGENEVREFADDIAAALTDFVQAPILEELFTEFEAISNLGLNLKKTVCIPLWPGGIQELQPTLKVRIPSWAHMHIDSKGTYLGCVIGPGKGDSSWIKPMEKYKNRVCR